jgi:hypothetical protein
MGNSMLSGRSQAARTPGMDVEVVPVDDTQEND